MGNRLRGEQRTIQNRLQELNAERRAAQTFLSDQALFRLMAHACAEISPSFQLIVLDHAHLSDDWFEEAIVEEWRGSAALVPIDWSER
ncbi:DUF3732 domain-containing protein [Bradyrhizobium sp. CSA207]|nr:DUF3732 domain-containing protein [Bradyrhizobium sp. CSA207]